MDSAMDNLTRMELASTALHPTLCIPLTLLICLILTLPQSIAERDIKIPLHIDVYRARGKAEPSNVNGIDFTATSARENVVKLESASSISASQMMLTTPSWRPCTRNSSRGHSIRLRPRPAVSSTV
jgi:hypothetical protein